jgi:hypothetical protein
MPGHEPFGAHGGGGSKKAERHWGQRTSIRTQGFNLVSTYYPEFGEMEAEEK